MDTGFVNKVADSGILTLDLANYLPAESELKIFDLKPFLFMELILKEKDFRDALKNLDWQLYAGLNVGVTCTADAIIPVWAYMLVAGYLQPVAKRILMLKAGQLLEQEVLLKNLEQIEAGEFAGKRVVIKGCGDKEISSAAYMCITAILRPVAKSIMYGEPCSTVPIFKQKSTG